MATQNLRPLIIIGRMNNLPIVRIPFPREPGSRAGTSWFELDNRFCTSSVLQAEVAAIVGEELVQTAIQFYLDWLPTKPAKTLH